MKRLIKRGLKALWRWTHPLRRPLLRKFEHYLARCLRPTERILTDETNLLMNHVVRELSRLERQVEHLRLTVEELSVARDGFAIVGEDERLKAG